MSGSCRFHDVDNAENGVTRGEDDTEKMIAPPIRVPPATIAMTPSVLNYRSKCSCFAPVNYEFGKNVNSSKSQYSGGCKRSDTQPGIIILEKCLRRLVEPGLCALMCVEICRGGRIQNCLQTRVYETHRRQHRRRSGPSCSRRTARSTSPWNGCGP